MSILLCTKWFASSSLQHQRTMGRPLPRHLDNPLPRSPVSLARFPFYFLWVDTSPFLSCPCRCLGWVSHALPHAVPSATRHSLWQTQITAMMMMMMRMMTTVTSRFFSNLLYALAGPVRSPLFPATDMTYALPSIVGRIASVFSFWRVERAALV